MALTRIRVLNQQSTYNVDRLNANTLVVGGNNITGASGAGGGIVISSVVYLAANGTPLIANAAPTTGNSVIKIIGSGFAANANVFLNGLLQPSANVTFVDSTELRLNMPALASNTYSLMTFNAAGAGAVFYSGVRFDPYPIWTTGTYSVFAFPVSTQLLVTGYGSGSIAFSLASGNTLPSGLSLAANGILSGTTTEGTYNFYVNATDSENEITTQQITLTISLNDTYFPYNSLLLSASSQSANNVSTETFIDSSNNNFAVASVNAFGVGGSVVTPADQGSFSPFPATGTWSCYLNHGSNSGLTTSYNGTVGSGDFTAEGFFFITQRTDNTGLMLTSSTLGVIMLQSGGKLSSYFTDTSFIVWQNSTLILNTWHHIVVQRASGTLSAYLNGTRLGTQSGSTQGWTYSSITGGLIGYDGGNVGGYFSNCRISTIARYSGATITVPTSPFTSDADTVFLIAASNRFIDTSSNSRNVTVNGTVKITRFNPFGANGASYSASTNSGSIYFNNTIAQCLDLGASTNLALGSGDFTVELWVYPLALNAATNVLLDWREASGAPSNTPVLTLSSDNTPVFYFTVGGSSFSGSTIVPLNAWSHLSVVRSGSTVTMYLNGVSIGTATNSQNLLNGKFYVNNSYVGGNYNLNGYISNVRILKGTALYTSAFTPPTTPLTAITNTQLLLLSANSKFLDSTKINNVKNSGGVAVRTDIKNYGTNSWYFNGSSRLVIPANPVLNLIGNFTIELWVYFSATLPSFSELVCTSSNGTAGAGMTELYVAANGSLYYYAQGSTILTSSAGVVTTNTWYHITLVKNGTSQALYVNGTSVASATSSTQPNVGYDWSIGDRIASAYPLTGYIQDLRITNGIARYTTTFTPPTGPVPTA